MRRGKSWHRTVENLVVAKNCPEIGLLLCGVIAQQLQLPSIVHHPLTEYPENYSSTGASRWARYLESDELGIAPKPLGIRELPPLDRRLLMAIGPNLTEELSDPASHVSRRLACWTPPWS